MSNEELLVQVGRIIGETVQASEARMTQRITEEISGLRDELSTRLDRVESDLNEVKVSVATLERSMCQMRCETEKMALEIAAGLEKKRPLPM